MFDKNKVSKRRAELKAISSPTANKILTSLDSGPKTDQELTRAYSLDRFGQRRYLNGLVRNGFVKKKGNTYSILKSKVAEIKKTL